MNFGQAIEALKAGKRVQRKGWNGQGMFVFMQVPSVIVKEKVAFMQSLPEAVKEEFFSQFDNEDFKTNAIYYENQFAIVKPDNGINGWALSAADCLAEDWVILD